jgi:hypothetical protein
MDASVMGGGVPSQSTADVTGPTISEEVIEITFAPHKCAGSAPSPDGLQSTEHRGLPQRARRPIAAVTSRLGRRQQRSRRRRDVARIGDIADRFDRNLLGLAPSPSQIAARDARGADREPLQERDGARGVVRAQDAHVVVDELQPNIAEKIIDVRVRGFVFIDCISNHVPQGPLKTTHELTPRIVLATQHGLDQRRVVERFRARHAFARDGKTLRRRCVTARSGVIVRSSR